MAFTREVLAGSSRIMRYSQGARRATQFSPGYSMARWVWKLSPRRPAVTQTRCSVSIRKFLASRTSSPCKYQPGSYESDISNRFEYESFDLKYSDTGISEISNFLLHCSLIRACLSASEYQAAILSCDVIPPKFTVAINLINIFIARIAMHEMGLHSDTRNGRVN